MSLGFLAFGPKLFASASQQNACRSVVRLPLHADPAQHAPGDAEHEPEPTNQIATDAQDPKAQDQEAEAQEA